MFVCVSQAATQSLMTNTGMWDQFNEAMISETNGALSMNADIAVLDEVYLPHDIPDTDNFTYYDSLAIKAITDQGINYWESMVRDARWIGTRGAASM